MSIDKIRTLVAEARVFEDSDNPSGVYKTLNAIEAELDKFQPMTDGWIGDVVKEHASRPQNTEDHAIGHEDPLWWFKSNGALIEIHIKPELDKEAEPVAGLEEAARQWYLDRYGVDVDECGYGHSARRNVGDLVEFASLHTHPPQAAGLTVEEAMDIVEQWLIDWCHKPDPEAEDYASLRARVTAAIEAKKHLNR